VPDKAYGSGGEGEHGTRCKVKDLEVAKETVVKDLNENRLHVEGFKQIPAFPVCGCTGLSDVPPDSA
jgi:hypothetical protein